MPNSTSQFAVFLVLGAAALGCQNRADNQANTANRNYAKARSAVAAEFEESPSERNETPPVGSTKASKEAITAPQPEPDRDSSPSETAAAPADTNSANAIAPPTEVKPVPIPPANRESTSSKQSSANWPNWMGPKWDGVSNEKGWSVNWPRKGLNNAWTRQIGTGFSSVSIADGRLFSMGHANGKETVYCLDTQNGKDVWTRSYDAPLVDNLHEGGPGATPTIHGESVYTVSKGGKLLSLQRDSGNIQWTVELQDELDVELPEWGFNGSPYILDNMLILEAGRVVAFDKASGKKLWQSDKHTAGYGSVTSFEQDGKTLIASLDCDGLRIVNARDGSEIAFERWDSPFDTNSTTPIIVDEKIFISSAYNVGCGLFELKSGKLELVYHNRDMRNHFNNSILFEGHLYGFDGNSNLGRVVHLKCMNAKTGEVAWKQRGLGCGSLMIANGRLVLLSERGELVIADATPDEFRELTRTTILQGRCWTAPVLHGGKVYARNARGKLVCVQLPHAE